MIEKELTIFFHTKTKDSSSLNSNTKQQTHLIYSCARSVDVGVVGVI